ncbi:hypothetical protein K8Z61_14200 [Nocardioides sp. TRM66260-LWL]|uniref:hypothetical protein n=1 Tax=Nocardioides sp. TRM66260-LWL TaxID=2874478 RepID=UPI001CC67EBE|nr:hypothetical protein [Nocardioides sp. TRM66260-LWL]MBZ5735643.1 hypothetical protein [Nocardioides sp. TRM66260-LWL]
MPFERDRTGRPVQRLSGQPRLGRSGHMNDHALAASAGGRLSLGDAAARTGLDRSTLLRRCQEGNYPGAIQATTGRRSWSVPVGDLIAAGDLDPSVAACLTPGQAQAPTAIDDDASSVAQLRDQLAALQALADERDRHIESLKMVIQLLGSDHSR